MTPLPEPKEENAFLPPVSAGNFRRKTFSILDGFSLFFSSLAAGGLVSLFLTSFLVLATCTLGWSKWIPDKALFFVLPVLLLLATGFFFRVIRRQEKKGSGKELPCTKRRGTSFLLWGTPAFLLITGGLVISFHTESDLWLLPGLFLFIAVLLLSLFLPFVMEARNDGRRVFSFLAALGVFFFTGLVLGRTGHALEYEGEDVSGIPKLSSGQKKLFFPPNAKKIKLSGTTMAFQYTCTLEEKDFLAFQKENSYSFKTETDFRLLHEADGSCRECDSPRQTFSNRRRDGGGASFTYIPGEKKFYGSWSHH